MLAEQVKSIPASRLTPSSSHVELRHQLFQVKQCLGGELNVLRIFLSPGEKWRRRKFGKTLEREYEKGTWWALWLSSKITSDIGSRR